MVARPHRLEGAALAIQGALGELLEGDTRDRMRIAENEWGHLEVTVGNDRFKDMPEDDRANLVWKHLRENLEPRHFGQLSEITVLDCHEYDGLIRFDQWINRAAGGDEGAFEDWPLS